MRTIDFLKFVAVFAWCIGYVLVLHLIPLDLRPDSTRTALVVVGIFLTGMALPWFGFYRVTLNTPAAMRRESTARISFATLVGLGLAIPTWIAMLVYALAVGNGELAQ